MGQALRRATGRFKSSNLKTPTKSSSSPVQDQIADSGRNAPSESKSQRPIQVKSDSWNPKKDPDTIPEQGVLSRKDPRYDIMLNKMLGRVRVKPGGNLEMGEPSIGPESKRPIPKLQKTKVSTGPDENKIVAPGKLNVSQLRQILLLHEGKAENQEKPMDAKGLAEKFQVDILIIQKILHYVSLPSEPKPNTEAEGKQN